ncbi:maleylpyruvate isomerase N-terminal domain-containing protein [Mucilaginibacter aquatilis]|uniref:Mycothiol-dependent maleylpyruvate isomerase metal-binding domain-containing protein n=1 Tax=Mucilaginibacter aquatilis TaxID=1517760 RepID=A0A6I4I9P6_9SPHI|nr:maleylpyruvate isomerase N-terminal domain-containing protein [Mucilaginibacter aquatilis]MVN91851.1 hypothetical protein [Mucilaginibacter aquatilis]
MSSQVPIPTLHLFAKLDQLLLDVLRPLSIDAWDSPTLSPQWTIKDIAAHLLDGNLRTLSILRDGFRGDPPVNINGYRDLVNYLNDLNTIWVLAYKRISPRLLLQMLETTGTEYLECLEKLEPFAPAMFSVAWAGENESQNWFHVAREYTEKWHHQQQIREALGLQQELMSAELFHPCIETFMKALPNAYKSADAVVGTIVKVEVTGAGGDVWYIEKTLAGWRFINNMAMVPPAAYICMPDTIAWKLFTKALKYPDVNGLIKTEGEATLVSPVLNMLTVMA